MKQNFAFRMLFADILLIEFLKKISLFYFLYLFSIFFTCIVCFVSHVRVSYVIKVLLLLLLLDGFCGCSL